MRSPPRPSVTDALIVTQSVVLEAGACGSTFLGGILNRAAEFAGDRPRPRMAWSGAEKVHPVRVSRACA